MAAFLVHSFIEPMVHDSLPGFDSLQGLVEKIYLLALQNVKENFKLLKSNVFLNMVIRSQ